MKGNAMNFLKSLVSKKLGVTAAAIALIQSLPMSADMQGVATAVIAFGYVVAQAWVDSHEPAAAPEPKADE